MAHDKHISYALTSHANNRDYYFLANRDKYLPGMQREVHKLSRLFFWQIATNIRHHSMANIFARFVIMSRTKVVQEHLRTTRD